MITTRQSSLRTILAAPVAFATIVFATAAAAQAYPDRPIHLVVPSPPGGGTDGISRLVANAITEAEGWTIVIENRPGAGGNIGMEAVAKSAPDGYTIVMGESANLAINPYLYKSMPFDPTKDVVPVALAGTVPLVLVVSITSPIDSVAALVAEAKRRSLTFASSGNGTRGHLVGESFKRAAGIDYLHVPYKGAGPVMTDLLGGRVDLHFASLPAAMSLVKGGKLRALAVTSRKRVPQLPDVPTLAESGFPNFEYQVLYGVMAPAGTPPDRVARLNGAIERALASPTLREKLAGIGVNEHPGTPEDFAKFLTSERSKFAEAVKVSGAKVD
jgi:tripartite-type tricarboxylate transporter receptor subunit TctC